MNKNSIGNEPTMRNTEPLSMGDMSTMGWEAVLGTIDRYELLSELGGGGFGSVYLARDTVVDVLVAVKGLPPLVKNIPDELERIRANFALVSQLSHPIIAGLKVLHLTQRAVYHDSSVKEKLRVMPGDYLVVMEYAKGVTLSQWKRQFKDGRVPYDLAIEICRQIAEALDYAHTQKIVHRDVKPSNVMVAQSAPLHSVEGGKLDVGCGTKVCPPVSGGSKAGESKNKPSFIPHPSSLRIKVLDFGLAAEIRSSMSRVSKESGDTSGTRPYMAPEQWAGKKQGAATDQYSLAVLFYELVSGEVPFASAFDTGDPMVMQGAVLNLQPESVEGLSKRQSAALLRGLAKEPGERFGSCGEFVGVLGNKNFLPPVFARKRGYAVAQQRAQRHRGEKGRSSKVLKFGSSKVGGGASRVKRVVAALVVLGLVAVVSIYSVKSISTKEWSVTLEKVIGPESGNNWKSPSTGMEFVWIPALKMWVGKYEVTNGEYRKKDDSKEYEGRSLNGERQPVVEVNYDDAVAYAGWLTERDHADGKLPAEYSYRLPTEDEWMTFAQCGDGRAYPWGDNWPPRSGQAGNYSDESAKIKLGLSGIDGYRDGHAVTCNVEDSWANSWGLYGVGGNVWECASAKSQGNFGAWRGGSWVYSDQDYLRCSSRSFNVGSFRNVYSGFRLVLSR